MLAVNYVEAALFGRLTRELPAFDGNGQEGRRGDNVVGEWLSAVVGGLQLTAPSALSSSWGHPTSPKHQVYSPGWDIDGQTNMTSVRGVKSKFSMASPVSGLEGAYRGHSHWSGDSFANERR